MAKRIQGAHLDHYDTATGPRWRVRWRERGRYFSKTFTTEQAAKVYARQVGVALQVHSLVRDHTIEPAPLAETLTKYLVILAARSRTGSLYADNVKALITRCQQQGGWQFTTDIDAAALDAVVYAYGQHRSTARKTVIAIKTFLRWVRQQRIAIDAEVLDYKAPKHTPGESVAWTEEEVGVLMKELNRPNHAEVIPSGIGTGRGSKEIVDRMLATRVWKIRQGLLPLVMLMARYGPRPVEVTRLTVAHWHSRTQSLHMPGTITKNGHPRTFVVDADTARWLDAAASTRDPWDMTLDAVHTRRPGTEPLFRNRFGKGWRHDSLKQAIAIQIKNAGIRGSPYSLRHTACTRLCRLAQGDLAVVQSITGHRTLSELQKYLHITADRQRVIADAYMARIQAEPPAAEVVQLLTKPG